MKYHEIFLMNHVYVGHLNKRIPKRLCARDEIADPNKIIDIVFNPTTPSTPPEQRWRMLKRHNCLVQYRRIEYQREFYEDVSSSHFYVMTADVDIFKDAQTVDANSAEQMYEYLRYYQDKLFLITTPVFTLHNSESELLELQYSIPSNISQFPPLIIHRGNTAEMNFDNLIDSQCYTICNGMNIFLAMIRTNIWNARKARIAIHKWHYVYKSSTIPITMNSELSEIWQFLYTNHPVPMIAEFPIYYATMYPSVPTTFYKYLEDEDVVPLSQFIDDNTDDEHIKCLYTTPITSMFPYFNKAIFDYFNPNFINTDATTTIFETPFGLEENEDTQQIDVEGFFIAIIRSRRAWQWWKHNGVNYLKKIWKINNKSHAFFNHCLQILFYLYEKPYKNIKYPRNRIRAIWNLLFTVFDINSSNIHLFMIVHVVKRVVYNTFHILRTNTEMPLAFLIDIWRHYNDTLNWFDIHKYKLYTAHDINIMLSAFGSHIHLQNEDIREYILQCSLYQLFKLDNTYQTFINYIFEKRMREKLLCIDRMFGIKTEHRNRFNVPDNTAYTVGILLKEYIRDHRNILI